MKIDEARQVLKDHGYYVSNLWHIDDVKGLFQCTDEEAYEILDDALTADNLYTEVWCNITYQGHELKLTPINLE